MASLIMIIVLILPLNVFGEETKTPECSNSSTSPSIEEREGLIKNEECWKSGWIFHFGITYEDESFESSASKKTALFQKVKTKFEKNLSHDTGTEASLILDLDRESSDYDIEKMVWKKKWNVFSLTAGRSKLHLGGIEVVRSFEQISFISDYNQLWLPLVRQNESYSANNLTLSAHLVGQISLQITEDVQDQYHDDPEQAGWHYFNKRSQQPLGVISWQSQYFGLQPILQMTSYDLNHSRYINASLGWNFKNFQGYFDLAYDKRAAQSEYEERFHEFHHMTSSVSWLFHKVQIFSKASYLRVKQPEIDGIGNSSIDLFDDNSRHYSFGVAHQSVSDRSIMPYFAYNLHSQKINTNPRDPFVTQTLDHSKVKIGLKTSW